MASGDWATSAPNLMVLALKKWIWAHFVHFELTLAGNAALATDVLYLCVCSSLFVYLENSGIVQDLLF